MSEMSSERNTPLTSTGLPADLTTGSTRSLLLTVLAELVWPNGVPARTSALVAVMTGMGVDERTARQAITRAGRSHWITAERRGREAVWRLTPHALDLFEEGYRRVRALSDRYDDWDGRWFVVFVSVPHLLRARRQKLYDGLTWAGFGNPAPGIWLTPHSQRQDRVRALIERLDLTTSTISFVGEIEDVGLNEGTIVRQGWNLPGLAEHYASVEEAFRDARPAHGDETLYTQMRLLNEWQNFPYSDPQLPEALAPDWIGRRVSQLIEQLRAGWAPDVSARWAELNAMPEDLTRHAVRA
jgi:phenylacetic acid degradation operon negative regulatory protein